MSVLRLLSHKEKPTNIMAALAAFMYIINKVFGTLTFHLLVVTQRAKHLHNNDNQTNNKNQREFKASCVHNGRKPWQ